MNTVDQTDSNSSNSYSFRVTVGRQQLEDFDQAITRRADNDSSCSIPVPLTFPATWFGLSEVQSSIVALVVAPENRNRFVLLHLEQSIEMLGQLEVDRTYTLEIQVGELKEDGRLPVSAQVVDPQMETMANLISQFALVESKEMPQ